MEAVVILIHRFGGQTSEGVGAKEDGKTCSLANFGDEEGGRRNEEKG